MSSFDRVGAAVDHAARQLREQLGDATAPIAVLAPNHLNNWFVRRGVAAVGPQIRVFYYTPDSLLSELSTRPLANRGLRPEGFRRRSAVTTEIILELAARGELEPFNDTLTVPGWRRTVTTTLARLESEGLTSQELVALHDDEAVEQRLHILRMVLRSLESRRTAAGFAGPNELRDAAIEGLDDPNAPCNDMRGVIVLGDRDLDRATYLPLRAWLERRPFARVVAPPLDNVKIGDIPSLRAIGHPSFTVEVNRKAALGHIQKRLFRDALGDGVPQDSSLRLHLTPDEVRENEEIARLVQRAIVDGTPLDEIAIVLPDAEGREPLASALGRAGIPAVWFVTRPLTESPAAKFLMLCLEMAGGRQGCARWYDLLRQRRLRLKANMGELPVGKGRWRRYLSDCGSFGGGTNIVAALRAISPTLEDAIDREGTLSLGRTIETVVRDIEELRNHRDLAGFVRSWSSFLYKWWRHSYDRAQVMTVLEGLASAGVGVPLDFDTAVEELRGTLDSTQLQEGDLGSPAVRVLPPMACAGADFEVVFVAGVVQGRFPVRKKPDPLLNDAVVDALRERHPDVVLQRDTELVEARRFAAAASCARTQLHLCVPAYEGLAERPRIPSVFALDVASGLLGRRATYRDLGNLIERRGSLAYPYPTDPDDALTAREYLVSQLGAGNADFAEQVASHRFARKLLFLHRDLAASDDRRPITTLTDPGQFRLDALNGEPLRARDLELLLENPGGFLFRRVLGAYRPRRLQDWFQPLSTWWIDDQLAEALRRACEDNAPLGEAVAAQWKALLDESMEHNDLDEPIRQVVAQLGQRQCERLELLVDQQLGGVTNYDDPAQVVADLPWRVVPGPVRMHHETVVELLANSGNVGTVRAVIQMLTLGSLGAEVQSTVALDPSGTTKEVSLGKKAQEVVDALVPLTTLIESGAWPWGKDDAWTLKDDQTIKLTPDRYKTLAAWEER